MILADSTKFLRRAMAAIGAAGVFTALALASSESVWAQAPPDPPPDESCPPRIMVDFCRDVRGSQGFLLTKGNFTTLVFPGATLTALFDINNRGQMVGTYVDAQGPTRGGFTHGLAIDKDGVFTTIDVPGPLETEIFGINDRGQMVGAFEDTSGITRGFLLDDGVFTPIDAPGAATETVLFEINNRGQILGGYVDAGGTRRSFVLEDGVFTDFAFPGASRTAGFDINDRSQIVGFYIDDVGPGHGFLLDKGTFITIDIADDSGPQPTQIFAINNRGQMAGNFLDLPASGPLPDVEPVRQFLRDSKGNVTMIDHPEAAPNRTAALALNDRGDIVGSFQTNDQAAGGR
jgi:probable HAF family extracellular repeat protein